MKDIGRRKYIQKAHTETQQWIWLLQLHPIENNT